ncbi:putative O-methyltransferase YrrM [Crossiella equi]|uniref:O-methyltransferase YrrM n=1 Tax=Crossiella equi TaxID=130796 RepID=A0ABS5A6H9_9PSEU|nr:class I SAM-dependent methyltransferase [Crossiella equi]MBP2472204.1 putative O-methyltransferase YrrM [Crossiella equi]
MTTTQHKDLVWYASTIARAVQDIGTRAAKEVNSALLELRGPAEFRHGVWDAVDSIAGFNRERADSLVLYSLAKNAPGKGVAVEVGSFLGRSTAIMALGVRASGAGRVVAIDPHRGGTGDINSEDPQAEATTYDLMVHNLRRLGLLDLVDIERADAPEAGRNWVHGPVRLLFIDALHTYENTLSDFEAIEPYLDEDSVVVFDDYCAQEYPGVIRAADELERAGRLPTPARTLNRYRVFGVRSWSDALS